MAKILVVDDDTAILDMIGTILNKDGHLVTKVSNPLETVSYTHLTLPTKA